MTDDSRLPTSNQWLDPTPEMLDDPRFEAIWQVIKSWDINVPSAYRGYCGATGNHVRAILDALSGDSSAPETTNDDAARYRWMKEHWIGFECRTKEGPMRLIANIDKDLDGWIDACRFNRLYEPPAQETSISPRSLAEGANTAGRQHPSKVHDTGSNPVGDAITTENSRCPKCQSTDTSPLTFDVLECESCGHEFTPSVLKASAPRTPVYPDDWKKPNKVGCNNFQLRGGEYCGNCGFHASEHNNV